MLLGYNGTGTYNLSGTGSINIVPGGYLVVGSSGTGTFNQGGGSVTIGGGFLYLGENSTSNGSYTLSGGSLSVNGNEYVAYSGTGTFTHSAGSNSANSFYVGYAAGSSGSYTLSDSGSLTFGSGGLFVGYDGTGTFNQTGGTNNSTQSGLILGYDAGSAGTYTLSGGTLSVPYVYVGGFNTGPGGQGVLTVSGTGALTIPTTGTLSIYNTPGNAINLNGGSITTGALDLSGNPALFNWSTGTLNLSNSGLVVDMAGLLGPVLSMGTGKNLQVSGALTVSNTAGSLLILNGGSISAGSLNLSGSNSNFSWTSGNLRLSSIIIIDSSSSATFPAGLLTIGAGQTLSTGRSQFVGYDGTGTLNQTGGLNSYPIPIAGQLEVGVNSGSVGIYNLSGGSLGSSAFVSGQQNIGVSGTGTFNQSGGVNRATGVNLGLEAGSTGTYNLSAGTLTTTYSGQLVGVHGTGHFEQTGGANSLGSDPLFLGIYSGSSGTYSLSGGTVSAASVYVGGGDPFGTGGPDNPGGQGVLTVSGTGALTIPSTGTLTVYNAPGNAINLNGGTITTGALNLSGNTYLPGNPLLFNWTSGTLNLTNSNVVVDSSASANPFFSSSLSLSTGKELDISGGEIVGNSGTGTVTQTGGNSTIFTYPNNFFSTYGLVVGANSGSTGTYNLGSGSLSVTRFELIGYQGSGTFLQTGGSNSTEGIVLGNGSYSLSAGNVTSQFLYVGSFGPATFIQSGGTINMTYDVVNLWVQDAGSYSMSGGSLQALGEHITGAFYHSGGTNTLSGDLVIANDGGGNFYGGKYSISGTAELNVQGSEYVAFDTDDKFFGFGSARLVQSGGANNVGASVIVTTSAYANANSIACYSITGGSATIGDSVYVGGFSFQTSGGTGVMNVCKTGLLTIAVR